jgi:uncharacterized protein
MNTTTTPGAEHGMRPALNDLDGKQRPVGTLIAVLALALLVVGGLNWALVGMFRVDLVATVFGVMSPITRFIYMLVGLAALVVIGLVPRLTNNHDQDR